MVLQSYDQSSLLVPVWVDEVMGIRYNTVNQLVRINRILALRHLDLSLDENTQLLIEDLTLEEVREMLKLRQSEIR